MGDQSATGTPTPNLTPPNPVVPPAPVDVTAPVQPTAPATPPPAAKPEVVTAAPTHNGPNKALIFVTVLILVVVIGIFAAFLYFKSGQTDQAANAPSEAAVTQTVVATPPPTASPEPTVDELTMEADQSIKSLDTEISAVDQGLADRQGDLSE